MLPSNIPSHSVFHNPEFQQHNFPTAAEYDLRFRSRRHNRRRIVWSVGTVLAVSIFVALLVRKTDVRDDGFRSSPVVRLGNFQVLQEFAVDEIQAHVVLYQHKRTKTQILTLVPSDVQQDSVFGINFKTLPDNDKGAGHVLMHSLWDGSEHYPVKAPIEELRRGSLQTYLEAKMLADRTTYLAASRHLKDFQNLMDVMLDAVFKPLCIKKEHKWIFRQEGWRLERRNPNTRALRFNGVTFNEMKGLYDDPDELMKRYSRRNLMGDTHYKFDADGRPQDILDLRHEDVIKFYQDFYHPSNAQVFLYGHVDSIRTGLSAVDMHLQKYRERLDIPERAKAKWQPLNLQTPKEESRSFPSIVEDRSNPNSNNSTRGNNHVSITWLINDSAMEKRIQLTWLVLEHLLLGSSDSILRRTLEQSGLGTEVVGGLETTYQQWTFSVGMKGVADQNINATEYLIQDTLQRLVDGPGFSKDQRDAAMNTIEMKLRDQSSGNLPRGVVLFERMIKNWNYNDDVEEALSFGDSMTKLILSNNGIHNEKSELYLDLLRTHVVENTHRCHSQLFPRRAAASENGRLEDKKIDEMRNTLSEEQFTKLVAESIELREKQEQSDPPNALATIPRLSLSEINPGTMENNIRLQAESQVLVAKTAVTSSFQMAYIDFGLDLGSVEFNDAFLLPLVYRLMLTSGTKLYPPDELQDHIKMVSSGITVETLVEDVKSQGQEATAQYHVMPGTHLATKAFFRGRCLGSTVVQYLSVLKEVMFAGRPFKRETVIKTLREMKEEFEEKLANEGDRFVRRRLEARYSYHAMIWETLEGLYAFHRIVEMVSPGYDIDFLLARLEQVRSRMVEGHRSGMILSITSEAEWLEASDEVFGAFLEDDVPLNDKSQLVDHPGNSVHPWVHQMRVEQSKIFPIQNEGFVGPTTVSYVGKAGKLFEIDELVDGSSSVVTKFLEDGYLFQKVREEGGAVDAFARLNIRHGTIDFVSFRDPSVAQTLDAYDEIAHELSRGILAVDRLPDGAHEAIIATIGELDGVAPQPGEIGWEFLREFIRDDHSDSRQMWRDQILNTTRSNFVDFINKFLELEQPSAAVLSSKLELLETLNSTPVKLNLVELE